MRQIKDFLNFSLALAENTIMKRTMQYVILILIILGLQFSFFTNFRQLEKGSDFDKRAIAALSKQNKMLQAQVDSFQQPVSRSLASVSSNPQISSKNIDMGEFYFSQYEYYSTKENLKEALNSLEKVKEKSLDPVLVPKSVYSKIKLKCNKQLLPECVDEIDFLVQQYPESEWTGASMQWLAQNYQKMNRAKEAQTLRSIVDKEFSKKWKKL